MGVWKGAKSVEGDYRYIYDQESEFVWVLSSQPSIPPSLSFWISIYRMSNRSAIRLYWQTVLFSLRNLHEEKIQFWVGLEQGCQLKRWWKIQWMPLFWQGPYLIKVRCRINLCKPPLMPFNFCKLKVLLKAVYNFMAKETVWKAGMMFLSSCLVVISTLWLFWGQ